MAMPSGVNLENEFNMAGSFQLFAVQIGVHAY
jgi:hypothetical protein